MYIVITHTLYSGDKQIRAYSGVHTVVTAIVSDDYDMRNAAIIKKIHSYYIIYTFVTLRLVVA